MFRTYSATILASLVLQAALVNLPPARADGADKSAASPQGGNPSIADKLTTPQQEVDPSIASTKRTVPSDQEVDPRQAVRIVPTIEHQEVDPIVAEIGKSDLGVDRVG